MTTTDTPATFSPEFVARLLAKYAKGHHAGAFATPLAKEIPPDAIRTWRGNGGVAVALVKTLDRPQSRRDFTGEPVTIPAGATVVQHVGRTDPGPVPDLRPFDYAWSYVEDRELSSALARQGFRRIGVKVSAASEILVCWRRGHGSPDVETLPYADADRATCRRVEIPPWLTPDVDALAAEVANVNGWYDDFPFYSDGSWSSLSLAGFRPDDPTWGIKPSEMPRKWQTEHPEAAGYVCDWTVLAEETPKARAFVEGIGWWHSRERVRLLRMAGTGHGVLRRHTDVTDRAAGTADGKIARFHVPIITHPDITMTTWDLSGSPTTRHLAAGGCYYLDARKPHAVSNPTGVNRVHLVVDVVCDVEVRGRISAGDET